MSGTWLCDAQVLNDVTNCIRRASTPDDVSATMQRTNEANHHRLSDYANGNLTASTHSIASRNSRLKFLPPPFHHRRSSAPSFYTRIDQVHRVDMDSYYYEWMWCGLDDKRRW